MFPCDPIGVLSWCCNGWEFIDQLRQRTDADPPAPRSEIGGSFR